MNPINALKKHLPFHFTFYFFIFHLPCQPFTSLYFAIHNYNSLPFTFYFLSSSLSLNCYLFPNPRFENMRFTVGSPYRTFR